MLTRQTLLSATVVIMHILVYKSFPGDCGSCTFSATWMMAFSSFAPFAIMPSYLSSRSVAMNIPDAAWHHDDMCEVAAAKPYN